MKSNLPPADIKINGRTYPMWSQFVNRENEWIGGTLEDFGDRLDQIFSGSSSHVTKITGIELRPNGPDSASFHVNGAVFSCGGDVQYLGITSGEQGWITFSGYGGHKWRIKKP